MPPRFTLDGDSEDFFQPLGVDTNRGRGFLRTVGRLRRGVDARASARRHVDDREAARTAVSRHACRCRRQPRADGRRRRAKGQDGPVDDHVGRRRRTADCVRERRQPHARARRHTSAGAGAARRARRRTASPGAAAPHRERRDCRSRRGARPARRTLDRISARRGGGRSISCSRDRECADRWHGAPLHHLCLGGSRSWVRYRAGVRMPFEGSERTPARGVPIGDRSSCATRAAGAGDRGNSARAGACSSAVEH